MTKHVNTAVNAWGFAIPKTKYAIKLGFAHQVHLLRTPDGGSSQLFIDARLKLDVTRHKCVASGL